MYYREIVQTYNEEEEKLYGDRLISFCLENEQIINFQFFLFLFNVTINISVFYFQIKVVYFSACTNINRVLFFNKKYYFARNKCSLMLRTSAHTTTFPRNQVKTSVLRTQPNLLSQLSAVICSKTLLPPPSCFVYHYPSFRILYTNSKSL